MSDRKKNINPKFYEALSEYKIKCKCGHTLILLKGESMICSYCGRKVYKNKQAEFKDKMNKAFKKVK